MKTTHPSPAAVSAASRAADLTIQRAGHAKRGLKLARTNYKAARKTLKQARKASRKAAKLAKRAQRRLDKLQSQIAKGKKNAPARKTKVNARMLASVKPANGASQPE